MQSEPWAWWKPLKRGEFTAMEPCNVPKFLKVCGIWNVLHLRTVILWLAKFLLVVYLSLSFFRKLSKNFFWTILNLQLLQYVLLYLKFINYSTFGMEFAQQKRVNLAVQPVILCESRANSSSNLSPRSPALSVTDLKRRVPRLLIISCPWICSWQTCKVTTWLWKSSLFMVSWLWQWGAEQWRSKEVLWQMTATGKSKVSWNLWKTPDRISAIP